MSDIIKSFKGFDKELKCRGFQYEIGETYETDKAKACEEGFHACEQPIEVFRYYPPSTSRYCEVEQSGETDRGSDDSKIASSRIKIGAEIGIPGIVKAQIEYVKAHTTTEHTDPERATAGYAGAATAGEYGAATAGNRGAATSRGSSAVGENGIAVVRGNNVKAKGGLGAVLVLCEESIASYDVKYKRMLVVDGVKIKADTWYGIRGGKVKEVE